MNTGDIIIYQSPEGHTSVDVRVEHDTVWLNLNQIAELFGRDKSVISRHLKNIYSENELDPQATVAKNATVQNEAGREVSRDIEYYNLDAIISVGYRVNSVRGTQFRIWANKILKDYLVKGYDLNEKRLKEQEAQLDQLKQTMRLLGNVVENKELNSDEAMGLLKVLTDYTYALDVLDQYDHQQLEVKGTTKIDLFQITYNDAMSAINSLRN